MPAHYLNTIWRASSKKVSSKFCSPKKNSSSEEAFSLLFGQTRKTRLTPYAKRSFFTWGGGIQQEKRRASNTSTTPPIRQNQCKFSSSSVGSMDIAHCYLDGNVDAVEFCPHDSFQHVLAACTYTLQEGDQPNRTGSISLYSVDADVGSLELFHHVETAGIFDMKWNPVGVNMDPLLAQADADGYLKLHSLQGCSNGPETGVSMLKEVGGELISSSMCLCLDWNPSATSISVGLSNGSASIITLREDQLKIEQTWEAHEFEVWATSFDTHQPHLVYTGSDDCRFSCWDLRESPSTMAFQNSKVHKMGVCCITKNPTDPNTLFTGSYDEHLRIWDVRSISKPVNESSICLGGGVWRIKYHPSIPGLIMAACMHNGFAVVRIREGNTEVVETYGKHNSLAYGADWQRGKLCKKDGRERPVVATCSFYDRLLRIWLPENEVLT